MRADMFKVIVGRPRWGASHAPSPKLKRTRDQNIKQIGTKRHARIASAYSKSLNENLSPLVRFLRSRCGRRWDDVFSEICAHLDTGSTVKMHVRQHLEDFVLVPISIGRQGEWLCKGKMVGRFDNWSRTREFFVDPTDGILREHAELAARLPQANKDRKGAR